MKDLTVHSIFDKTAKSIFQLNVNTFLYSILGMFLPKQESDERLQIIMIMHPLAGKKSICIPA